MDVECVFCGKCTWGRKAQEALSNDNRKVLQCFVIHTLVSCCVRVIVLVWSAAAREPAERLALSDNALLSQL